MQVRHFPSTCFFSHLPGFFEEIHPMYPFLNRRTFESIATSTELEHRLSSDHAWAATYYAVLSLGMSYEEPGSFAPFGGPSWTAFRRAMKLFPLLLIARPSLGVLQVSRMLSNLRVLADFTGYDKHGRLSSSKLQGRRLSTDTIRRCSP